MKPCRSDCPQGDCANCVGFADQQPDRCEPKNCDQSCRCLRSKLPARWVLGERVVIDASAARKAIGFCPMFVDVRGSALLASNLARLRVLRAAS